MLTITAQDLALGYESNIIAEGINFRIEEGDYLCIVGENGSGKTTLMRTLLGLNRAAKGGIVFDGVDRSEIGYLPQQTEVQKDFPASVKEIVLSGCRTRSGFGFFRGKAETEEAMKNLELMGADGLAHRCYRELSGGQQQRVLLARALCAAKKVLLLDEPVSGLDPKATEELYGIIAKLNDGGRGMTVIMISHDIKSAVKYANMILHIGKKVFFGTTGEYLASGLSGICTHEHGGERNV